MKHMRTTLSRMGFVTVRHSLREKYFRRKRGSPRMFTRGVSAPFPFLFWRCPWPPAAPGRIRPCTCDLYALDYENSVLLAGDFFSGENYITLKSGGSAEMCLENDKANVRWKMDGDKLTVTAAESGSSGPWAYSYWKNDGGEYQRFEFLTLGT